MRRWIYQYIDPGGFGCLATLDAARIARGASLLRLCLYNLIVCHFDSCCGRCRRSEKKKKKKKGKAGVKRLTEEHRATFIMSLANSSPFL